MINVASGGTLYGDIPLEIGTEVIHRNNGEVMHEIVLTEPYPLFSQKNKIHLWSTHGTIKV